MSAFWLTLRQERVPMLVAVSAMVLAAGSILVLVAETVDPTGRIRSLGDALWFGIVTMVTVGYGDITPSTGSGRLVAVGMMLGGTALLSVLTATFASVLVARRIREDRGLDTIRATGHLIVCGWNQYADRMLEGLVEADHEHPVVLVNELPEEQLSDVLARHRGVRYVRGDPASEPTLERASVRQAFGAIVLADASAHAPDERATLVTLALKSLRPQLRVTVEVVDAKSEPHLRRAGADEVISSGEFNAFLLASATTAPGISAVVRPLLTHGRSELRRIAIPEEFVGRTFGELAKALRERDGTLAIAVVTEEAGLGLADLLTDDTSLVDVFIRQQFRQAGTEHLRFGRGSVGARVNPPDSHILERTDWIVGIPGQHETA